MKPSLHNQTLIQEDWISQLTNVITDFNELLELLGLSHHSDLVAQKTVKDSFSLRVPRSFVERMRKGDPKDPLFLQVATSQSELISTLGYNTDPLSERSYMFSGILHKYHNRALFLVKGHCAIHCRYCFRRYFPYKEHKGNKVNWQKSVQYIQKQNDIDEIILSGGDPLIATDDELSWLFTQLEKIPHLKRIRIHTRLIVIIPQRITAAFCRRIEKSRLKVLIVTHINHEQEINDQLSNGILMLTRSGVTCLNQSVLLRNVNDNAVTLAALSNALFDAGILPYYLHLLDKVQGSAHFYVSDNRARIIFRDFITRVSGYMVPKLVREIPGKLSKTPIDLHMRQDKKI
ncbi:EF-P beta-lysylation protein EpmB [Candidatus Erwinia haradaeae]|uniref:L-lysine 2,3-aminomutase n=1 Tax=Candidatus Erwinia haradaeae TaxID=1922217 RepID=A0A451DMM1_9GAMM|nr:EF-P beta-lysylation protein EpmB [Candidatus Erwinia haradaeae]VFP88008.1 L-lysine 2,3-aminomutase [Candidatus Erwinia haradaeae]